MVIRQHYTNVAMLLSSELTYENIA